jgi:hypothetical protein
MDTVERARDRRPVVHAIPHAGARAASSHCRGRMGWYPAVIVRATRWGAVSLRNLAVPRLTGRARRERLAVRDSRGPEHLGCSIRTSDTGDFVLRIRFSRTNHTGLCWFQLLDVSRKDWRFLSEASLARLPYQ